MSEMLMKAVRMHAFGGIEALSYEDVLRPTPEAGQVLVRIDAAGVGPWDAWVREGKSVLPQPLPLVPGSDLSGVVVAVGSGVSSVAPADAVFGVTNTRFTGAYAEYAVTEAAMIARKPATLTDIEAAALPVAASTAWQMVFDHARITAGQRLLVLGAAGSVCAYALAAGIFRRRARDRRGPGEPTGLCTLARRSRSDRCGGRRLRTGRGLLRRCPRHDWRRDAPAIFRPAPARRHRCVCRCPEPDRDEAARHSVRAVFFLTAVSTASLDRIAAMIEAKTLRHPRIGEVLPLSQARLAHEMLAGRPHKSGKIVLVPGSSRPAKPRSRPDAKAA